jgi:multimeric flavodoxin WrbA
MNFLIIHGSPRKGNTWKLVELFKEELSRKEDINFYDIFLSSYNIPLCKGCYNCFLFGEDNCPDNSKIQDIVNKMYSADAIIFTSPVYALNISGTLKNFIDHTAYLYHRPYFFDKKALILVSTVGGGAKRTANYIKETLKYWGFNKVYTFFTNCYSLDYNPSYKEKNRFFNLVNKFYKDVKSQRLYPPNLKWIIIYNVWRALSATSKDINSPDKLYWEREKLLYFPYSPKVKIGIVKRKIGNFFFKVFKMIFSR